MIGVGQETRGVLVLTERMLLGVAAAFMLLDAVGYSLGALGPIQRALKPPDQYWRRRLLLNVLLANQGLYFAGVTAVVGAIYVDTQPRAAQAIEILCLVTCAYTLVTVPLITPKDWSHVVPRGLAGVLIVAALTLR